MATLTENAQRIVNALHDIKAAIISKGVTPGDKCETFADAIAQIETGGGVNGMYFSVTNLTTAAQSFDCGFRPTKVMNICNATNKNLFSGCINDNGSTRGVRTGSSGAGALGSAIEVTITDAGFTAKTTNSAFNNLRNEFIAIKE